jgi:hypothetical protein
MRNNRFNPRVLYTLLSALIIIGGTLLAIEYAKGGFRITRRGFLPNSGLLSANSFPTGGEVYIDGKLVTATDDTIYLEPNTYNVEIIKDGFWPWKKQVKIQEELVVQTNAQLFPIAPSLTPLTFTGAQKVLPSPDGQKILYYTTTASTPAKNGLYVLELTDSLLALQRGSRQITDLPDTFSLDNAEFIWSPDSNEVMVLTPEKEVVLALDKKQDMDVMADVSFSRRQTLTEWEAEMYLRERQFLAEFPTEIIQIATESARNVYISPDKKRLLYTATQPVTIPEGLVPPVPAPNSEPQVRQLVPENVYIYDREEDTNFNLGVEPTGTAQKYLLATDLFNRQPLDITASPIAFRRLQATDSAQTAANFNRYHSGLHLNSFQWFTDSKHILYTQNNGVQAVQIKGYDNTNDTTVYSGPFESSFVYPWPDGSKLLILTTFNPESPVNLYAIELR